MLIKVLLVFLGGGIGSLLRYLASEAIGKSKVFQGFPLATFVVNIIGCFLIGISLSLIKENTLSKYLFITGFCGGFTTFSTFSAENIQLWESQQYFLLSVYVLASLIMGMLCVFTGFATGKLFV